MDPGQGAIEVGTTDRPVAATFHRIQKGHLCSQGGQAPEFGAGAAFSMSGKLSTIHLSRHWNPGEGLTQQPFPRLCFRRRHIDQGIETTASEQGRIHIPGPIGGPDKQQFSRLSFKTV